MRLSVCVYLLTVLFLVSTILSGKLNKSLTKRVKCILLSNEVWVNRIEGLARYVDVCLLAHNWHLNHVSDWLGGWTGCLNSYGCSSSSRGHQQNKVAAVNASILILPLRTSSGMGVCCPGKSLFVLFSWAASEEDETAAFRFSTLGPSVKKKHKMNYFSLYKYDFPTSNSMSWLYGIVVFILYACRWSKMNR